MMTVRQIERLWNANDFPRLARELLAGRIEQSGRTLLACAHRVPAAALALIRIDEFSQNFHPLCSKLVPTLLAAQHPDGTWGDADMTALVLRALSTAKGHGLAVDRGLSALAQLQKEDGHFPRIPIRRAESDPQTTALVVHHLARVPNAGAVVNLAKARAALTPVKSLVQTDRFGGPDLFAAARITRRGDLAVA